MQKVYCPALSGSLLAIHIGLSFSDKINIEVSCLY